MKGDYIMKLNLANNIKKYRKQKDMTQEALAECLGVSPQAVSRWENNTTYPDMELIPVLAHLFEISTDELFDYNLYEIEQRVSAIVDEYSKYYDADLAKAEKILRAGLEQYPGNDTLLNCLIGTIPIPERSEEVISLCKQLVETTQYDDVKYDAWRIMAEAYCSVDNYELAREAIEKIPEIYFSKLSVEALLLKDAESGEAARKQKWLSFEDLIRMMDRISYDYAKQGNTLKALAEAERAQRLINAMEDEPSIANFKNYSNQFEAHIEKLKSRKS